MNKSNFFTIEIKNILSRLQRENEDKLKSSTVVSEVSGFIKKIQKIEPDKEFTDNAWTFWIKSLRGNISIFGNFEELKEDGEVDNYEDFVSLWKMEFPYKTEWHKLDVVEYNHTFYFYLDSEMLLRYCTDNRTITGINSKDHKLKQFVLQVVNFVNTEVGKFLKNPDNYNKYIAKKLPLRKRYGKIQRKVIWENLTESIRFDQQLGNKKIKKLEYLVNNINEKKVFEKITANEFLRCCEICYEANNYFKNTKTKMSPLEKYKSMADLRHGGLLDIDPDSPKEFAKWYKSGIWSGSHPWEICRGGNSTHITLQVTNDTDGWKLSLAGLYRQVETINMALALFEQAIPFVFRNKVEMLNMAKGIDYLGVVPENVVPKYCHGKFPKEDNIIDFINPWYDNELSKIIEKSVFWYPLKKIFKRND